MIAGGPAACSNDGISTVHPSRRRLRLRTWTPVACSTPAHDAGALACPDPGTAAPADVFCIGLYADHDPTHYAASALPYTPGVVLWSDGAEKQRYLALPPSTQIDTSDMDAWKFPVGTKAFKEFRFDGKLVETRLVWKQSEPTGSSRTYIWDDAQTNAPLNESRSRRAARERLRDPERARLRQVPSRWRGQAARRRSRGARAADGQGRHARELGRGAPAEQPAGEDLDHAAGRRQRQGRRGARLSARQLRHAVPFVARPRPCDRALAAHPRRRVLAVSNAEDDAGVASDSTFTDLTQTDTYRVTVNQKPTTASVAAKFPDALRITPGVARQEPGLAARASARRVPDAAARQPQGRRRRNAEARRLDRRAVSRGNKKKQTRFDRHRSPAWRASQARSSSRMTASASSSTGRSARSSANASNATAGARARWPRWPIRIRRSAAERARLLAAKPVAHAAVLRRVPRGA